MVKRNVFVISLSVFVLALVFFNIVTVHFFGIPFSPVAITGRAVETGIVLLYVEGGPKIITIDSPLNITYDDNSYTCSGIGFPKCNNSRYLLPLNVSADFPLENPPNDWAYTLYDLKHGDWIEKTRISFASGQNIPFVRWGNRLTVYANEKDRDWIEKIVVFNVDVPNSFPIIQNFSEKIFVCESDELEWTLPESRFSIWDVDEEDYSGAVTISPTVDGTFGVNYLSRNGSISRIEMVSIPFTKIRVGNHIEKITVTDPNNNSWIAINYTNITVIAINNPPVIYSRGVANSTGIGAQTIHMNGTNSVFVHQMDVRDTEDGNPDDENMTFTLKWISSESLDFVFNSSNGNMSYVPNPGDQGGGESKTYSVSVCATDNALASVHENFSVCSDREHSSDNITVCDNFTLTITEKNRPPRIVSHFPIAAIVSTNSMDSILFNVTVADEDMVNAYPDINWYLDGVWLVDEFVENLPSDSFSYTFGCGVSGYHNVKVLTSDGEANVSFVWTVNVTNVPCSVSPPGGGSPGGGSSTGGSSLGVNCRELWSCDDWGVCQNVERSFRAGSLSPEDFSSARDLCLQNEYEERFCGFQITECFDVQECDSVQYAVPRPAENRVCYFTENPSCTDKITNCHSGSCELLVDCGGPCDPCPTCSDGKRNQGEGDVDCGGPCPYACEPETPLGVTNTILIVLLIVLFVVAIFIIIKLINILRYRFFIFGAKKKKKKKDERA